MKPAAWVRYWIFGCLLGPALAIYGIAAGDGGLIFLGFAILFVAIGMIAMWRRRAAEEPPSHPR